jgi:hypothetical protein
MISGSVARNSDQQTTEADWSLKLQIVKYDPESAGLGPKKYPGEAQ